MILIGFTHSLTDKPIIFLDFDGVLNTIRSKKETDFTPDSIDALNLLYEMVPYSIVLSTSWKNAYLFSELVSLLKEKGIKAPVIDKTPEYTGTYTDNDDKPASEAEFNRQIRPDAGRNAEVLHFINHYSVNQYLILDDWQFTNPELKKHQVLTCWLTEGLTAEYLPDMIAILQKGDKT